MVWIVEYDNHGNDDHKITSWSSEDDALKHAVSEIITNINNIYYYPEPDLIRAVEKISHYLETNNYKQIINYWNHCDYNMDSGNPVYWEVSESLTKPYRGAVGIFDKKKFPFTDKSAAPTPSAGGLINNHTCVQCGNNRLNKKEKSCWSCGTPIKP